MNHSKESPNPGARNKPFMPLRPPANNHGNKPSELNNAMTTKHINEHDENGRIQDKRDLVPSSGHLTPERKALQPPSNREGRNVKSDTNAADLGQLGTKEKSRVKSPGPHQGLSTKDSESSPSPAGSPGPLRSPVQRSAKLATEDRDRKFLQGDPQTTGISYDPSSLSSGYISSLSPTSPPKSMTPIYGSRDVLNDLFRSERGSNKRLKAVAGFMTGLILGVVLMIGLYYGLSYGLVTAFVITAVSTLLMSLCLAFTVRGRCVASLMVPTLCTQQGRAAFLAIVVTLLLNGPINNIFLNANEVSNSMSCSAELAYNQSQRIQQIASEVYDQYVMNLETTVGNLQDFVNGVQEVLGLRPLGDGLNDIRTTVNDVFEVFDDCKDIAKETKNDCNDVRSEVTDTKNDCRRAFPNNFGIGIPGVPDIPNPGSPDIPNPGSPDIPNVPGVDIDGVCDIFDPVADATNTLCEGVTSSLNTLCQSPAVVGETLDDAISQITDQFLAEIDFSSYFDQRANQSDTFQNIQDAIEEDIDDAIEIIGYVFSILEKLVASSVIFLLYRSYRYHTAYRTKDKFDNFYLTQKFIELDKAQKESGKKTLLPLKKSEKVRLIDVTSLKLSKTEKGLFKLGVVTLMTHICIATILILVDNGFYWLLLIIRKHGSIQADITGESGLTLDIPGNSAISYLIREFFGEFRYSNSFDISYDNTRCLPDGSPPNNVLSIGIGICYLMATFMVLFQAYALRLRPRIAAYFYPEREMERLYFIYNDTLKKRQTLSKVLKDIIKQKKKEHDAKQKVSIRVYLAERYPICKKIFKILHISKEQTLCFGCDSDDDGTFKQCVGCKGKYCEECLEGTNNTCTICDERFEDIHKTIEQTSEARL
ncbi:DC-STAMP domain-containing protein 2-like [Amphiura filiformis]|uniref:DC-STAMP domain-containing protein 2-like n=1 Tax=Amphiura filiformis TaxID=82378 RepID=UPI003B2267B1